MGKCLEIDFYLGLPREEVYRVARLTQPTTLDSLRHMASFAGLYTAYKFHSAGTLFSRLLENPSWMFENVRSHCYFAQVYRFFVPRM